MTDSAKQKSKDKRNNIIVIALALVLVAVLVLFFMQRQEHTTILNEMNAEKDSIQFELTQIAASYDSLKTENDTINEQLYFAQTKVKDLLVEVEQTKKVSFQKISGYQKQVGTLQKIMRDFVAQIDSLNERNKILMAENLEVKEQFKESENRNQQLTQEKKQLQQRVQRAAMLEARELVAEPITERGKVAKTARRAKQIKVYMILSKNVTAKRGSKDIYVRIQRPDQLLMVKDQNNLFQFEDLKIQYSAKRNVVYEGQELPLAVYWDNTGEPELMKGEYVISVFADGNEIGETTFSITR